MTVARSKHDAFFKRMMKNKKLARDFFATYLPQKILRVVDLSELKLEDSSFVDEDLYEHESDVLFCVKRKDTEKNCFLYVLCEHQSTADPEMPFRLIYYLMQFLKRYLVDHRSSPFPLPLIYPLVVYNGNTPWNTHRNFIHLFAEPIAWMRDVFLEPFAILDVGQIEEGNLKKAHLSNLMLASLIRAKSIQDIECKIKLLDELLQSCGIETHSGILRSMLKYFVSCIDPSDRKASAYLLVIQQSFSPKYQEVAMNLLEHIKEEGYQEGAKEALKKTALRMLKEGVDKSFVTRITGLLPNEVHELAELCEA